MSFDAYIFDLDGTLLDTLPDLVNLTNMVLAEQGMPTHTTEEINSFVGYGARVLLSRAAAPGTSDEKVGEIMARWKSLYSEYGHRYTKPYEGMPETLAQLKSAGAKLGVLSNKFDAAVGDVIGRHFPGVFDMARGECAEIPRKPDPTGLLWMAESFGVAPERVAYVGDSGGDMKVAVAAGTYPVGVSWGYRPVEDLLENGAKRIIQTPADLLAL